MARQILFVLTIAQALHGSVPAVGIKETANLVVSGPGLRGEITITDPAATAANVFSGNFIGAPSNEPDKTWPRFAVSFYVNTRERGVAMLYAVRYVPEVRTGGGFVYIPVRGDPEYDRNIGTIMRREEGGWHRAPPAWARALNARIPNS